MVSQALIFTAILLLFILWMLNRTRIHYWVELLQERGWKSTIHYDRCLTIFKNLYTNINPMETSLNERRKKEIMGDVTYTYGEVTYYSFVRIVEKAEPQIGDVFYDLGSGGGKAVFIAGLVFDFSKACGIEKLENLYELSMQLVTKLQDLPERKALLPNKVVPVEFIHGDFLEVDFSDADIVFVNATCFKGELFDALIKELLKLKVGTRIILGSASLDEIGGFELKYQHHHLMSWGLSHIRIYKRV